MDKLVLLIPIIIGCIGILQGTINKKISDTIGVAQATLVGTIGSLIICIILYLLVKQYSTYFPELFHVKAPFKTYRWWYIFPGIMGVIIVATLPYAFSKLGAVSVTVGLISSQMVTSVLWDYFADGIGVNFSKAVGILFALLSVLFITFGK